MNVKKTKSSKKIVQKIAMSMTSTQAIPLLSVDSGFITD